MVDDIRVEILTDQQRVLVFSPSSADKYCASVQVMINGDRGMTSGLAGERFYQAMLRYGPTLMGQMGLRVLYGYVSEAHARLLKQTMSNLLQVERDGAGKVNGKDMVWMRVSMP